MTDIKERLKAEANFLKQAETHWENSSMWCIERCKQAGHYMDDAIAEIEAKDKRIAELEAALDAINNPQAVQKTREDLDSEANHRRKNDENRSLNQQKQPDKQAD